MKLIRAVFLKELIDGLRDRRSVATIAINIFLIPIIIYVSLTIVTDKASDDKVIDLPIAGQQFSPKLVEWLAQQKNINILEVADDYRKAVKAGDLDVVLVIPEDYAEKFSKAKNIKLELVGDSSRDKSDSAMGRVKKLLAQYSSGIGQMRLLLRGVSAEALNPISIYTYDLSANEGFGASVLMMFPFYLILLAFISPIQISVDSIAGERERQSLEPLLLTPVPTSYFVIGKWLVSSLFSFAGVSLTYLFMYIAVKNAPLYELGIDIQIHLHMVVNSLLAMLPVCFLFPAIQITAAAFARSFKEAQTSMGMLSMLAFTPFLIGMAIELDKLSWVNYVPLLSTQALLDGIYKSKVPVASDYFIAAIVTMLSACLLVYVGSQLLKREKIIFGR